MLLITISWKLKKSLQRQPSTQSFFSLYLEGSDQQNLATTSRIETPRSFVNRFGLVSQPKNSKGNRPNAGNLCNFFHFRPNLFILQIGDASLKMRPLHNGQPRR